MNVLLSAYACRPDAGSEPGAGWNWAIHLAQSGCDVYLLTAGRNRQAIEAYLERNPCPSLHPHFIDVPFVSPMSSGAKHYLPWQWIATRCARSLAATVRIDIVHHVSYGSVHIPTQMWRLGLPTVFGPVGGGQTTPESMLSYFGAGEKSERKRNWMTRLLPKLWIYRHSMQRMRLVLAANSETLGFVRQAGCSNVKLMSDTGARADFRSAAPRQFTGEFSAERPMRLMWVGRFVPRKGLTVALDALAQAREYIHLTLIGEGLNREAVHGMIADRGLTGRVHWEGKRLPWMQVREAYASHDALLFTSIRDSFGSQNIEAMCVGLPLIALDLSGVHDFIPADAAFKVAVDKTAAGTIRNLAKAIDDYSNLSPGERSAMSGAAWRGVENFLWTERVARARRLYQEILREGQPMHGQEVLVPTLSKHVERKEPLDAFEKLEG